MSDNLSLEALKSKFENNSKVKIGTYVLGGLVVLILLYFSYRQFIVKPSNEKSNDGWWIAMNYITKDSTDQAIKLLVPFVKKYDGNSGGEIGQYLLGTQYMKKGEFRKALDNFEGVSVDDSYLSVFCIGLQGDCLSDMKKYADAITKYEEAADKEENEMTTPMYLFKAGLCAEKLDKFEEAAVFYTRIKDDYPTYAGQKTIDKYISRASSNKSK